MDGLLNGWTYEWENKLMIGMNRNIDGCMDWLVDEEKPEDTFFPFC